MDFALPEIGEGVYEAEVVRWLVQPGAAVKRGQGLLEVLTDKATMEVPAPFAGTITALKVEPGQTVRIGDVLLSYTTSPTAAAPADEGATAAAPPPAREAAHPPGNGHPNGTRQAPRSGRLPVKASPSVRQMARQLGLDLERIQGSGPEGRILLDDLKAPLAAAAGQATGGKEQRQAPDLAPEFTRPGTRVKLQGLRRRIADHMSLAKRTIPHYSYVEECDLSAVVQLRDQLREPCARAGIKLTYLPFFVKAVVAALEAVPLVNASLDEAAGEIVLHDRYHIGIAVATPTGLIVPVIRDANRKDLVTLAREIDRLGSAARAGRSRREDLGDGTFTITSVGSLGGLISTPVINHPEVGILGIGKIVRRPVYDAAGQIRPADLVYLSLSFDHRVVDGAVGAAFTNVLVQQLQSPAAMLLPL